jgi:4-hydroxybenzoate polyprenyltransferase
LSLKAVLNLLVSRFSNRTQSHIVFDLTFLMDWLWRLPENLFGMIFMLRLQAPYTFPRIVDSNYPRQIRWLWGAAIAEAQLNWSFIRRDMLVSLVPGTLFGMAALLNYPVHGLGDLILVLLKEVIYCWLCITTFCLSSQLVGIEEDRLNKPDRPLVVGRVTRHGARIRWIIGMIALTSFAAVTGTLLWALTWQIGCLLYDYCGGAKHWYGKTLLGGIGVTSEIGAAWQLVEPTIPWLVWHWIAVIGTYLITLMAVQDFRDMAGDRAVGRRTMPIVFGEQFSRYVVAAGYFGFPIVVHYELMVPAGLTPLVIGWDGFLAGFAVTIGLRTLIYRNPQSDHRTYVGFTVLLCAYLACAIGVLRV